MSRGKLTEVRERLALFTIIAQTNYIFFLFNKEQNEDSTNNIDHESNTDKFGASRDENGE